MIIKGAGSPQTQTLNSPEPPPPTLTPPPNQAVQSDGVDGFKLMGAGVDETRNMLSTIMEQGGERGRPAGGGAGRVLAGRRLLSFSGC